VGQHRTGDSQHAEDVDVEDRAGFRIRSLLDRSHQATPCVVDKDIDSAELFDRGVHRAAHLLGLAHVEPDGKQPVAAVG